MKELKPFIEVIISEKNKIFTQNSQILLTTISPDEKIMNRFVQNQLAEAQCTSFKNKRYYSQIHEKTNLLWNNII